MVDLSALQDQIDAIAAQITKQGAEVRNLKKKDASNTEGIASAVKILQDLKIQAGELRAQFDEANGTKEEFNRKVFDQLVLRKMFVIPSFEIHGGVKGL